MNDLISEQTEDNEMIIMHDLIDKAAADLLKQLNEILELSEIESGKLLVHNNRFLLQKVIEEVVKTFESQTELKNLQISILFKNEIGFLESDKNKITDILSCLISNAVKFSKNGSITIKSYISENNLIISVEDCGIGLTEEQKKSIFNLFTQGDGSLTRVYGGIGVGLTLVHKLLELLNGTIDIKNNEYSGSIFSVSIPVKISNDQNSIIEIDHTKETDNYKDKQQSFDKSNLIDLFNELVKLNEKDNFIEMEKRLKKYREDYKFSDLNSESQLLFILAIGIKTKNKKKLLLY